MAKTISMQDFTKKVEQGNVNIIDVREGFEYKLMGHIPGAKNLPLSSLGANVQKLSKVDNYYIICQSGGRSAQACQQLSQAGYKVTNVQGGMGMWSGKKER